MNAIQNQRGTSFWIALAIVAAIFFLTPLVLIPVTDGSDGFQDLAILVSCMMLFGIESVLGIVSGLIVVTRSSHRQIGLGIWAGLVVGVIGGFAICLAVVRLIVL